MSYEKAMRWHKKHPKGGKPQYMGFDTGSGPTPSMWSNPAFVVGEWFKRRHEDGNSQHARECIRAQIKKAREEMLEN